MKPKYKRLVSISLILCVMLSGVILLVWALRNSAAFYVEPSDLDNMKLEDKVRIGGLITGYYTNTEHQYNFHSIDIAGQDKQQATLIYNGILPPMFRIGQGLNCDGTVIGARTVECDRLITKHDERYKVPDSK